MLLTFQPGVFHIMEPVFLSLPPCPGEEGCLRMLPRPHCCSTVGLTVHCLIRKGAGWGSQSPSLSPGMPWLGQGPSLQWTAFVRLDSGSSKGVKLYLCFEYTQSVCWLLCFFLELLPCCHFCHLLTSVGQCCPSRTSGMIECSGSVLPAWCPPVHVTVECLLCSMSKPSVGLQRTRRRAGRRCRGSTAWLVARWNQWKGTQGILAQRPGAVTLEQGPWACWRARPGALAGAGSRAC